MPALGALRAGASAGGGDGRSPGSRSAAAAALEIWTVTASEVLVPAVFCGVLADVSVTVMPATAERAWLVSVSPGCGGT